MGTEKNFVTSLHRSTKRNYIERMLNDKILCMKKAKEYGVDYWDGERKFGYGGYKFIEGRWTSVAKMMIEAYELTNQSRVIDLGAGKGFLMFELLQLLPGLQIAGLDLSSYALNNSKEEVRSYLSIHDIATELNYADKSFDLAISLGTFHNLRLPSLKTALGEIERIAQKKYIMVESYRNNTELFNLQCWALTAETFLDKEEWIWLFKEFGYSGDYEFIYFD